jgi:16S rRNA processing protein RimM
MLMLGHLAKIQGLKGEFLLHSVMEAPEKLADLRGLCLSPPDVLLDDTDEMPEGARQVKVRGFRWHQDRPCVAFEEFPDRTAAEPFKGWTLWSSSDLEQLPEGESYRHDWIGCLVIVGDAVVGEVLRLEPTPMGYDMVVLKDLRPGRRGVREVPFIKAWFELDIPGGRIHLDPPPGLLDLDRV